MTNRDKQSLHKTVRRHVVQIVGFAVPTLVFFAAFAGHAPPWIIGALMAAMLVAVCVWRDIQSFHIHTAYAALRRGDSDKALDIVLKAIKRNAKDVRAYCVAVEIYMKSQRYSDATDLCSQALQLNPDDISILCNRAWANFELRDYDQALLDVDRALFVDPNCFYAALKRLEILRSINRHEDAVDAADKILRLKPDSKDGCFGRALALFKINAYADALAALDTLAKVLDAQPSNAYMVAALCLRAGVCCEIGQYDKALDLTDKGLQIQPTYYLFTVNKAWIYFCLGRFDDAETLLATVPDDAHSKHTVAYKFSNLARLHARRGAIESASALVAKAIDLDHEEAEMYVTQAYVLAAANQDERAIESVNKAISLNKYASEAFWFRHKLNQKLGRIQDAEQDKTEALKYGFVPSL